MLLAPFLLSLAAAAAQQSPPAPTTPSFSSGRARRLFISPMGEPFRAKERDDDTLADWFTQADRNHDGRLTMEEMQQDAERFFALLDTNHDGEIDPDELNHYETDIAPEVQTRQSYAEMLESGDEGSAGERSGGRGGGHRHRGGGGGSFIRSANPDQHQGAARFGLLDLPEPVVAADSDFNRGVSLSEFKAAAQQRFLALDLDHKGYLTLEALESIRPAPPPMPNPPDITKQAPTDADFPPSPG